MNSYAPANSSSLIIVRNRWSAWLSRNRRVVAFAVTALFAVAWCERALPDIHDGVGLRVAQLSGVSHSADARQDMPLGPNSSPSSVPPGGMPHPVHVDHCTHNHVTAAVDTWHLAPPPISRTRNRASSGDEPLSVAADTDLRPPIA